MEPITVITLITSAIPFITAALKKILPTSRLEETHRRGVHALVPIVLGILSAGLYEYQRSSDVVSALAVGLGSGGAASSARDIEKNLVGALGSICAILQSRKEEHPDA